MTPELFLLVGMALGFAGGLVVAFEYRGRWLASTASAESYRTRWLQSEAANQRHAERAG